MTANFLFFLSAKLIKQMLIQRLLYQLEVAGKASGFGELDDQAVQLVWSSFQDRTVQAKRIVHPAGLSG